MGVAEVSVWGPIGGTCAGHNDKTKLPDKMLLAFWLFRVHYHNLWEPLCSKLQEHTRGQPPGHVPEWPAITAPCVKISKAMSTEWSLNGFLLCSVPPCTASRLCSLLRRSKAGTTNWLEPTFYSASKQAVLANAPGAMHFDYHFLWMPRANGQQAAARGPSNSHL